MMFYKGAINSLESKRGFGFVELNGDRVFFHKSELSGVTFDQLKVGVVVSFKVGENEKGKCAQSITLFDCSNGKESTRLDKIKSLIVDSKRNAPLCRADLKQKMSGTKKTLKGFLSNGLEVTGTRMLGYSRKLNEVKSKVEN